MKTKPGKKVATLVTAVLFVFGAASFAFAASAKSTGDINCPFMDSKALAKLDLTQAQMAKMQSACEEQMSSASQGSRAQSKDDWWSEYQTKSKRLYESY